MVEERQEGPQPAGPDPAGWETDRLTAQLLRPGHEPLLQLVFEQGADYFLRLKGTARPDADAAERELAACAATAGRDTAVLTDLGSGEPVGAVGWWLGNPEPGVALLGMLLIVPAHRGSGFAREAVLGLQGWLVERGVERLRTAVPARAFGEHRLVRALGFEQLPIRDHAALGLGASHLALFEKPLAPARPADADADVAP